MITNAVQRKIASILMHDVTETFDLALMVSQPRFNGAGFRSFSYHGDTDALRRAEHYLLMEHGILCSITPDARQLVVPSVLIDNEWLPSAEEAMSRNIRVDVDLSLVATFAQSCSLNA
jgi:hypothetical protein